MAKEYELVNTHYPGALLKRFKATFIEEPQKGDYIYHTEMDPMWNIVLGRSVHEDKIVLYVGPSEDPVTSIVKAYNKRGF